MTRTHTIIIMAAALLGAASCSVKEDRSPCPCWLGIDISQCTQRSVKVSAWSDQSLFSERVLPDDYPDTYEKAVPKGYVTTSVTSGENRSSRDGSRLIIPYGSDADSLWAHRALVECSGEFARDSAVLYKQFARVFIKVEKPKESDYTYPYTFIIKGEVCGTDLRDLMPVAGPFMVEVTPDDNEHCIFCLPRQEEDSRLTLDIMNGDELLSTLHLSSMINSSGYSWLSRNLEDIYIGVDYSRSEIRIGVRGWEEGYSFSVQI